MNIKQLVISFSLGLGLTLAWLWLLVGLGPGAIRAAPGDIYCVTPSGGAYGVCDQVFANPQAALSAATGGEEIRVAGGTYTDLHTATLASGQIISQVVYLDKGVRLRGGYTTADGFADPPDPEANPTTLDAQGQGRVIYVTGDISVTIEGLRITGGDASGLGGHTLQGGAICDAGGGIYVMNATAHVSRNQVFDNYAEFGGGMYLDHSAATLSANTIQANQAITAGGGLNVRHSPAATLTQNTFILNTGHRGAGLQIFSSNALLQDNVLIYNTSTSVGGGLELRGGSQATLSGNTVMANSASARGGGVHIFNSSATLNGNTITGNQANDGGGGLFLHRSTATLGDDMITANTVFTTGGGLWLATNSSATLSGTTVTGNEAAIGGGGLVLANSSHANLINAIIADNRLELITATGAGLRLAGASAHLQHTTIARNLGGDGSGLTVTEIRKKYVTGTETISSNVAMTNTVLVSHTTGISVAAGNTAYLDATLWGGGPWANQSDWGGLGTIITGINNFWGDPAFVDPDAEDYHIGPGSAALDAGVETNVTLDIDGQARPVGLGPDLGADEFPAALSLSKGANPDPVRAGATLSYTLYVTNTGQVTLSAVIIDRLPAQVDPGGMLAWGPVSIPPDEVWTESVLVNVVGDYDGPLTNVVEVTTEEGATGIYTQTATSVWADFNLVKEADRTTANVGETITYKYTVENTGAATLSQVSVVDNRLGPISLSTTSLVSGQVATGTATYTVQESDLPGSLNNWAEASAQPPVGETLKADTCEWVELSSSSITITKAASPTHDFDFWGDLGDFTLGSGESRHFPHLALGDYSVAEDPASLPSQSWHLLSVTCVDQAGQPVEGVVVDLPDLRALIPLGPDQHLTCTFLNERTTLEEDWYVSYLPVIFKGFDR